MTDYDLGLKPYEQLRDVIASLGFKLGKEEWKYADWVNSTIRDGRKAIARVEFYHTRHSGSMKVMPVDTASFGIMAGETHIVSQDRVEKALEEIEGLLRAYLVSRNRMPYAEFPSDRSLKRWASAVVEHCGPEGKKRFMPTSGASRKAYEAVAGLVGDYDRSRALKVQRILAGTPEHGDEAMGYMVRSAKNMADFPYGVHMLSWATGSNQSRIVQRPPAPPEREPLEEDLPSLSPR